MKTAYEQSLPLNPPPSRRQVVQAPDLSAAFELIRERFGSDALIVDTRPLSGELDGWVEVEVEDPSVELPTAPVEPSPAPEPDDRLRGLLRRLDSLTQAVDALEREPDPYPLADELRAVGCGERALRDLAADFERVSARGPRSRTAARRHLARRLVGARADALTQLRGEHWFAGRAGSGKTTLCLTLAQALREAGRRAVIITLSPRNPGDVRRVQTAARAMDVAAASAYTAADLVAIREHFDRRDVFLVDTPCAISHPTEVSPPGGAQVHLVTPLGEDPTQLAANAGHIDPPPAHLAITQADLCHRPGRVVELTGVCELPISMVMGRGSAGPEVRLPTTEALLEWVLPTPAELTAEA